jgi:hypothetical protein
MSDNPFEVLRLDPSADEQAAVRQAARLCQRATDETARNAVRQAVRQLTASAEERQLYALLTHPRPGHATSELDRFVAAFRRPPATSPDAAPCPGLDTKELAELLLVALAAELELTPLPLEAVDEPEPPAEIARQTGEALWRGLISDMRA